MNLDGWFTDTITIQAITDRDANGDPSYGAQFTALARVEEKQTRVRNREGQEVMSDTAIATEQAIGAQDRVWIPGADTTKVNQARTPISFKSGFNKARDLKLFEVFF